MAVPLATAFVRLRPDPDKRAFVTSAREMGREAGTEAGRSMGDGINRGLGRTVQKAGRDSSVFGSALALAAARMTLFGASAAGAAPAVVHLTAALAPAAGAVVALPAALLAAKAATATFKIAVAGVGPAIEKGFTGSAKEAEKAMKDLPPAAQTFARSIIGLKDQIKDLRASVSQRFFLPLQNEIKPLTERYLPLLKTGMSDLAGPLGGLGEQFAQSARKANVYRTVAATFGYTRQSVINLREAVNPLVQAFAYLIRSTLPFLPGLSSGFADLSQRVAKFVIEAARSGRIAEIFRNAMTTIRDLGGILGNVGSILRSVFSAATAGGNTLLSSLRELTGQVAAFLRTSEGMGALRTVFATLGQLGAALRTSLAAVLPAVAQSLGALGPVIAELATVAARFVVALAPLLPSVAGIAAVIGRALVPVLSAVAGWMERNQRAVAVLAGAIGGAVVVMQAIAIATKVWAAAQVALNVVLAANPIGLVVIAIGALVGAFVLAWRHSETFRNTTKATWAAIQAAIGAVSRWFTTTIMPSIRRAIDQGAAAFRFLERVGQVVWAGMRLYVTTWWNVIRGIFIGTRSWLTIIWTAFRTFGAIIGTVWRTMGAGIRAVWDSVRTGSFTPLRTFITSTLPNAFRTGVGAIRAAWERVQEAARKPVSFVVNSVINPLIRGYNRIAGVFHAPRAAEIAFGGPRAQAMGSFRGLARGGQIPGTPSTRDNRLAMAPSGPLAVASGEFITNTKSTLANLPLLQAINRKQGKVAIQDIDPFLDGMAKGGMVGDGIGDFFGKVRNGLEGVGNFIANPVAGLKRIFTGLMGRIPGGGLIVPLLKGMGSRVLAGVSKMLDFGGGGVGNGRAPRGVAALMAFIRRRFPGVPLISGFRPGARTLSGNRSGHALGLAVDLPAIRAVAAYIKATVGRYSRELITPWRDMNLLHGRPHRFSPAIERQHGVGSAGNDHIHWWGAQNGGLVGALSGMPVKLFDRGGMWPSGTLGANLSGRTEYVDPGKGGAMEFHAHFHAPVGDKRAAEALVYDAWKSLRRDGKIR